MGSPETHLLVSLFHKGSFRLVERRSDACHAAAFFPLKTRLNSISKDGDHISLKALFAFDHVVGYLVAFL